MNDSDLTELLLDLESDRCERKASAKDSKDICKAICAFANDLPNHGSAGVIFLGVLPSLLPSDFGDALG